MQHLFKSRPAKPWEHQVPVWILTQKRCVRNWRLEPIFRGTSSYQAIIKARAEAKQPLHPELELKSGPESDPRLWSRIIKTRAWEDGLAGKNACSTFMRVSFFKMQIASFPSIIYQRSCPFFYEYILAFWSKIKWLWLCGFISGSSILLMFLKIKNRADTWALYITPG